MLCLLPFSFLFSGLFSSFFLKLILKLILELILELILIQLDLVSNEILDLIFILLAIFRI